MSDLPNPDPTPQFSPDPSLMVAQTPFERDLLRWARTMELRIGKPRMFIFAWNGTRLCIYDTSQIK